MNRIALESIYSGRRSSFGSQLQQLRVGAGGMITGGDSDESLDLFSRTRRSDGDPIKVEKVTFGSAKIGKGLEELLDAEIGKHDYDWLLTPPETPLYPTAVARESPLSSTAPPDKESPLPSTAPRSRSTVRSVLNTRPSRLSASHTENGHSTKPARSSSVTRSSISSTFSNTSFSNNNNKTSVLNTSSASVTSSRPSTPRNRSTTPKPSSTSHPISRLPTPTRTRPNPNPNVSGNRNSRPSTPTSSRPQTPSNSSTLNSHANSRSSTPTRGPTSSSGATRVPSLGRVSTNTQNPVAPASRPSSPGPRPRAPVRPVNLPDFPMDAPPNLRTKLPQRPASAGRTRPGMALTLHANFNADAIPASSNTKNYMPVVSRGKFPENPPKATLGGLRRPSNLVSAKESTGFGRTISKNSLDMALRHMDIRNGMGGIRPSPVFPQSIRSTTTKSRPSRKSDPAVPLASDDGSCNETISPDCRSSAAIFENGDFTSREFELDLNGILHYDAFMLEDQDSKNMNWLHSVGDKSDDQSSEFDHQFEPLPEPFDF